MKQVAHPGRIIYCFGEKLSVQWRYGYVMLILSEQANWRKNFKRYKEEFCVECTLWELCFLQSGKYVQFHHEGIQFKIWYYTRLLMRPFPCWWVHFFLSLLVISKIVNTRLHCNLPPTSLEINTRRVSSEGGGFLHLRRFLLDANAIHIEFVG